MRYSKRDRRPRPTNKPLHLVPTASAPATYDGARLSRDGAVVMRWQAECGAIDVVYPYRFQMTSPIPALEEPILSRRGGLPDTWKENVAPDEAAVVVVGPGFRGSNGPELNEYAPDGDHDNEPLQWTELAGILGRPVPYWTYHLQDVEVLLSWRPGDPPVEVPTQPDLDTDPLTRLAGTLPPDNAAWKALMYLVWNAYSSDSAAQWLKDAAEVGGDVITFPLQPMANPCQMKLRGLSDEDKMVMRVGWREILERHDGLARSAVRVASTFDIGPRFFPYSLPIDLTPGHRYYTEINNRLTPSARTAGHERTLREQWFESGTTEPLWDPVTDTPALRLPDGDLQVMSPHGTLAPITEVVLIEDNQVWMRTDEKHAIPPVQDHNLDMKYGYSGGGTGAFERFLKAWAKTSTPHTSDIQAERCNNALASITDHAWPVGTTINRDQVKRVLNGEPAQDVIG